jgi:hypothetical protein
MSVELAVGGLAHAQRIEQHWGWQTVQRFYPDEYAAYTRFAVHRSSDVAGGCDPASL